MKKILGLYLCALPLCLGAQTNKWTTGIQYSQGRSNVRHMYQSRLDYTSFALGTSIYLHLNTHWSISSGLEYTQEGYQGTLDRRGQVYQPLYYTLSEKSNFIRIPLRLQYTQGAERHKLRPYAAAGMSAGIQYYRNGSGAYPLAHNRYTYEQLPVFCVAYPESNPFDIGWLGNLGVQIRCTSKWQLTVGMEYYQGLSKAIEAPEVYAIWLSPEAKKRQYLWFQLGVQRIW